MKKRLRRLFKLRFAVIYPVAVFAAFYSNSDDKSILASMGFIVMGLFIRLWANGYAVKMDKLTISGPYGIVRNPLYLGTMFIIIGFIIMLRLYYMGILFIAITAAIYYRTVKKEEAMLEAKFKKEYMDYKRKIHAIFPTFFFYREGERWSFSLRRLARSQEYKVVFWVVIFIITFYLKDEFMVEREGIKLKSLSLAIAAFVLGLSDVIAEFFRLRKKNNSKYILFGHQQ